MNRLLVTISRQGKKALLILLAIAACGVLLTASGCSLFQKKDIVVPDYPTAREQAEVAQIQYDRSKRAFEEDLKRDELEKTAAGLQKVLDNFPENLVYTPACTVMLGDVYMELEEFGKAESVFKSAIQNYQDIEDIHASALFGMARCLGKQNRLEEQNQYYQRLIDAYSGTDNPTIARQVSLANRRLKRIERK